MSSRSIFELRNRLLATHNIPRCAWIGDAKGKCIRYNKELDPDATFVYVRWNCQSPICYLRETKVKA